MICKDISSSVSDCNCAILLIRKSDIISFLVGLSLGGGGWPRGGGVELRVRVGDGDLLLFFLFVVAVLLFFVGGGGVSSPEEVCGFGSAFFFFLLDPKSFLCICFASLV